MFADILFLNQKLLLLFEIIPNLFEGIHKLIFAQMLNVVQPAESREVKEFQHEAVLDNSEKQEFDLLVIDDSESWQEIIIEALLDKRYSYDIASSYKEAVEKIQANKYRIICLSNFHNWFKLLIMLKKDYLEIPVIMISSDPFEGNIQNIQKRYPNVKEILFKGGEPDFVSDIRKTLTNMVLS